MRALGIDFGLARVGWAVSDDRLETVPERGFWEQGDHLLSEIARFITQHQITLVVVGRPLSLQSARTNMTEQVDRFLRVLKKTFPSIIVTSWEERLTSREANLYLRGQKKQKGDIDAMSAKLILVSYLASTKASRASSSI